VRLFREAAVTAPKSEATSASSNWALVINHTFLFIGCLLD
jgi:hypothetical protein